MKEEGSRNEAGVSAKKTKTRTNFLGRILGYTDSYYEAQEKAKQEKEEAERLAKVDMQRWLAKMKREEAQKEAAVAHAKMSRKQSKLQEKLDKIKKDRKQAEHLHQENVRILEDTIDAYTHMPEINKSVKPNPAHHAHRTEDELYHDPGIVDHKKFPNPSEALLKQSEYRDDHIPNPWWERPGIRTRRYEEEMSWEQVMHQNEYETYTPGHYSMFYGKDKIYAFPPKKKSDSKNEEADKKHERRYQWNHETQDYSRNGFRENAGKPLSLTFKDNNRSDQAFEPPTEDGLRQAIYRWRSDEQVFPETTLLPTAEQIKAMEAKKSRAKARAHLPAFDFRRNRLDMSRLRVRRFLVEDGGGSVDDAMDANSSVAASLADGSVVTSIVDVKLSRYNDSGKKLKGEDCGDGEGSTVVSDLQSTASPAMRFDGKPHIIHDMSKPMLSMKELTTMGLGGKAGPKHDADEGAHVAAKGVRDHNARFQDDLDKTFNTDRAKVVAEANKEGIVLDGIEVYRKVGDHYVLENKSAMSRRSDFEEDSLSQSRQKVSVKLKRHRGALGLDRFKMSGRNKLSLESKATKRERAVERRTKKQMVAKIAGVAKMVQDIKEEQDRLLYERQREAHRQGLS